MLSILGAVAVEDLFVFEMRTGALVSKTDLTK